MSKGQNVERTKCWSEKMSKVQNVEIKKTLKEYKIAGLVTTRQKNMSKEKMSKDKILIGKKMTQDKIFLLLSSFFKLLFAFDIPSLPHFVFWHFFPTFCPWTFWYRIKIAWEKTSKDKMSKNRLSKGQKVEIQNVENKFS